MRVALQFHEVQLKDELHRPVAAMAYYCSVINQLMKAEGLFNSATTMLGAVPSTFQLMCQQRTQRFSPRSASSASARS